MQKLLKKIIVLPFTIEFIGKGSIDYQSQNYIIHAEALGVAYQKQLIYHLYTQNKREQNAKLKLEVLTEAEVKETIAGTQKSMSDILKLKNHEIQALLPDYVILRGHINKDDYENLRNLAFMQNSMQPIDNGPSGTLQQNPTIINNGFGANNMMNNNMVNGNMSLNPVLNIDNTTHYFLSIANPHGTQDAFNLEEVDLERSSKKVFKYFRNARK